MTQERLVKLSTSQVKCFKTCRRRYYLEYIENLKPVETPKALAVGTLYHAGLELLLKGGSLEDAQHKVAELETLNCIEKDLDYDPVQVVIVCEMLRAWHNSSGYQTWHVLAVEKSFEVTTGYAKRLIGKIDGEIIHPETGKPYLIEHKTTSVWGEDYLHNLLWDEQSTNYLYAHQRMLDDGVIDGAAVEGIFYDVVEKPKLKPYSATPAELRKYIKDGSLYKGQRDTDEDIDSFRARVRAWFEERPRVHTAYVYRTPAEIEERIRDFNLCVKDIAAAERNQTWYRNPAACQVLSCPYRPKCLENRPDTDCLFSKKIKTNEEL